LPVPKKVVWGIIASVTATTLLAGCSNSAPRAVPAPLSANLSVAAVDVLTSLPVVSCPTTFGITPPPAPVRLPATVRIEVPRPLAAGLAVYDDTSHVMMLLAPRSWRCSAFFAADGSGGVTVVPHRETLPARPLDRHSSEQEIAAEETGGSPVQAAAQGCAYFPAAAAATRSDLDRRCGRRPPSEIVRQLGTTVVAFEDPSGTRGIGALSGGRNPVNGVMTYSPTKGPGFYIDSCTLPRAEHATCTAALNYFVTLYGQG